VGFFNLFLVFIFQGYIQKVNLINCVSGLQNVSGLQKYLRFQNEYNKVEIELRVVQFWTETRHEKVGQHGSMLPGNFFNLTGNF
jgi:hypothetical protein